MKIALLGGTGTVSKSFPAEWIRAGHEVRMLTRRPVEPYPGLTPLTGDALSAQEVASALEGCDAVVNAVGRLKNEGGFYAAITRNVLAGMKRHGVNRCLVVTSSAVRLESDGPSWLLSAGELLFGTVFPRMLDDKREELQLLHDSGAAWTVFRLPLVYAGEGKAARLSSTALNGLFLSTGAAATAVREELERPKFLQQAPFLFE